METKCNVFIQWQKRNVRITSALKELFIPFMSYDEKEIRNNTCIQAYVCKSLKMFSGPAQ